MRSNVTKFRQSSLRRASKPRKRPRPDELYKVRGTSWIPGNPYGGKHMLLRYSLKWW